MSGVPIHPRGSRMHVGGKLAFRGRKKLDGPDDLPLVIGGENPPHFEALVPEGFTDLEIEVGSGKGTFLVAAATAVPERFILGIEAAPAYAQLAAEKLQKAGTANALLLVDNAKLFLQDRVAARSLHRLHVYYPDPWPKRRHRKRRFFSDEMPALLAGILRDDGHLLVATDNACYAGQICSVLGASGWFRRDEVEEDRIRSGPQGIGFSPTSFERKYIEAGRILRRFAWRPLRRAEGDPR